MTNSEVIMVIGRITQEYCNVLPRDAVEFFAEGLRRRHRSVPDRYGAALSRCVGEFGDADGSAATEAARTSRYQGRCAHKVTVQLQSDKQGPPRAGLLHFCINRCGNRRQFRWQHERPQGGSQLCQAQH